MSEREYHAKDAQTEPDAKASVYNNGIYLNAPIEQAALHGTERVRLRANTGTKQVELIPTDSPDAGYAVSRNNSGFAVINCRGPLRDLLGEMPEGSVEVPWQKRAEGGVVLDLDGLAADDEVEP